MRKWTLARRFVQLAVMALIASPLAGLSFFRGNLAAGELFGFSLADPLAFLQAVWQRGSSSPHFSSPRW